MTQQYGTSRSDSDAAASFSITSKQFDNVLNQQMTSSKLINEGSDSGYRSEDVCFDPPVCENGSVCKSDSEFLFDDNTRHSFGSQNAEEKCEGNVSIMDISLPYKSDDIGKFCLFIQN